MLGVAEGVEDDGLGEEVSAKKEGGGVGRGRAGGGVLVTFEGNLLSPE